MANKTDLSTKTFNQAIADASNYIGQKLFAYITNGKHINDRIRDKFKKSLIFIGDEGQIYNPLTNTYVGIGQTAYTHTITYIEDAHEKIDQLNKMLTSSMVQSIYANWDQKVWDNMGNGNYVFGEELNGNEQPKDYLPSKIYATNDIVLRGIGDYDPVTKLAYTHETAHISDPNDPNQRNAIEGSFVKTTPTSAFATSGITVSLHKGLNRYMFTYTFLNASCIPGVDPTVFSQTDFDLAKDQDNYRDPFTKQVTLYFTTDEYITYFGADGKKYESESVEYSIPDFWGEGQPLTIYKTAATREDILTGKTDYDLGKDKNIQSFKAFVEGLKPVYDDAWKPVGTDHETPVKEDADYREYWQVTENLRNQLFKQNTNTITIDDSLTWSYVASAYSYTLDFSKKYTDDQVNRIYRDILGESSARLIPVSQEQIAVAVINEKAKFYKVDEDGEILKDADGNPIPDDNAKDRYTFSWDDKTYTWVTESLKNVKDEKDEDGVITEYNAVSYRSGDSIVDFNANLTKYVLNDSSLFVRAQEYPNAAELLSNGINTIYADTVNEGQVFPWFVLKGLADKIAIHTNEIEAAYLLANQTKPSRKQVIGYVLKNFSCSWDGGTFNGPSYVTINDESNLDNVYFMDWEADTKYATATVKYGAGTETIELDAKGNQGDKDESGANFDRGESNKDNFRGTTTGTKVTGDEETTVNGQYPRPGGGDWGGTPEVDYGYHGVHYSLHNIFKIIDDLNDIGNIDANGQGTLEQNHEEGYFVVNNKWTPMDNINLADGIQTLKEVAYILDMITDGWGNHYGDGDAESNGILLTYTIANNHDRIVDHERRLSNLESGKGVVKGIGKLDHLTSEFVRINLQSDQLWRFQQIVGAEDLTDPERNPGETFEEGKTLDAVEIDNIGNDSDWADRYAKYAVNWDWANTCNATTLSDLTKEIPQIKEELDWLGVFSLRGTIDSPHANDNGTFTAGTVELAQIPGYVIASYNALVRQYVMDQRYHKLFLTETDTLSVPEPSWDKVWSDGRDASDEHKMTLSTIVAATVWPDDHRELANQDTYTFVSPDKRYKGIHSYVGHVGIGIELKLAQTTYVCNNEHSKEGLEFVDINTSEKIKKALNIVVTLPKELKYFVEGSVDENGNKSTNDYTNNYNESGNPKPLYYAASVASGVDENGKPIKGLDYLDILSSKDKELLGEKLQAYNLGEYEEGNGINFNSCVDEDESTVIVEVVEGMPYAKFDFSFTIDPNDAVVDTTIIDKDGNTIEYTDKIYSSDDNNAWPLIPLATDTRTDKFEVNIPSNAQYWIKQKTNGNFTEIADTSVNGLTTSRWVELYVNNATKAFKQGVSDVQHETYLYAKGLIDGLDSEFLGRRGQVVIGLKQREGIVTPITQDLPETEVNASASFWGENTNIRKEYEGVTTEQITKQEIALDSSLFIAPAGKYDYILVTDGEHTDLVLNQTNLTVSDSTDADKAKYGFTDEALYPTYRDDPDPIDADTEGITPEYIRSSISYGFKAAVHIPLYVRQQAYMKIDGAQLKWNATNKAWEYKVPTGEVDTDNKPIYDVYSSTDNKDTSKILILKEVQPVLKERKYISASTVRQSDEFGGIGKNVTEITAHITKLSDATVDNSGLVDAYDVKETLENLFEWVDLSRYDVDGSVSNLVNPVNTQYLEEGGYRDDKTRISDMIEITDSKVVYPRAHYTDAELEKANISIDPRIANPEDTTPAE